MKSKTLSTSFRRCSNFCRLDECCKSERRNLKLFQLDSRFFFDCGFIIGFLLRSFFRKNRLWNYERVSGFGNMKCLYSLPYHYSSPLIFQISDFILLFRQVKNSGKNPYDNSRTWYILKIYSPKSSFSIRNLLYTVVSRKIFLILKITFSNRI